jgi:cytochrome c biogenesis protein CcmG, thiol:disulfide interchange protein DsbE
MRRLGPSALRAVAVRAAPALDARGLRTATLLAMGAVACAACFPAEAPPGSPGQPAPEYSAPTMQGDTVSLADLRGEVVLLNIWATWCAPCRVEMPHLQELHEELGGRGLRIVGVSVDSGSARGAVERFTDDLGIEFLILQDPRERISHVLGAYGVPFNVLIDREGIIRWRHSGPITADDPVLRGVLDEVLSEEAASAANAPS